MISIKSLLSVAFFGLQATAIPVYEELAQRAVQHSYLDHENRDLAPGTVKLLPIREESLFPHLRKRAFNDVSRLDFEREVRMVYAAGAHVAHMTIRQENSTREHPHILLENLEGLTKTISCKDKDVILEFNTAEALDYAIKTWDWVNQDQQDYFFLITHHHHDGCGLDEERAPQKITAVKYDKGTSIATLTRESVSWDEAAQNFDLKLSNAEPSVAIHLAKRDIFNVNWKCFMFGATGILACNAVKEGIAAVIENIGEFDESKSFAFEWPRKNNATETTAILSDPFKSDDDDKFLVVKCVDCGVSGNLVLRTYATRKNGGQTQIGATFQPNFSASLVTNVKFQPAIATDEKENTPFVKKLPEFSIPISPLAVPGVFTIGPEFVVFAEVELKVQVQMEFDIGFKFSTGQASFGLNFQDDVNFQTTGFDTIKPETVFEFKSGTVTSSLTPALNAGFRLGVSVLAGKGTVGAFAGLKASVGNSLTFGTKAEGFCESNPGLGTTGIQLKSEFKLEAGVKTGFELDGGSFLTYLLPAWDLKKEIAKAELLDKCTASPSSRTTRRRRRGITSYAPSTL
ncbi:hypothetical protein ABW20_dc0100972 [Dactylellina cionopaga]|nr:hypothetical protein ABW20_dc0100972 [Dactylellina cionopaga]